MRATLVLSGLLATAVIASSLFAEEPSVLSLTGISVTNAEVRLSWAPYPAAEGYHLQQAITPLEVFEEQLGGDRVGFSWSGAASNSHAFYRVTVDPMSEEALLTANVLNRLAYGPTPDELERILKGPSAIGPQAFIEEQLAPEGITEALDSEPLRDGWTFISATGTATGKRIALYLDGPGGVYIDDLKLVKGVVAEAGANLLVNGEFESAFGPPWIINASYAASVTSTAVSHAGKSSLLLQSPDAGGVGISIYQDYSGWKADEVYTLSYWYLPTNSNDHLVVRLSGNLVKTDHPIAPTRPPIAEKYAKLSAGQGDVASLRAWFVLHAVQSKRQLYEILTQFFDNHFVTEHSKSVDFFDRFYDGGAQLDRLAADLEFREISRWRQQLLDPKTTFRDLLQASAESPAQIIYLDTVDSRGDGSYIANENYARELMELYSMGVDNGYDQQDITVLSRAWTGWSVRLVDPANVGNPFALQTTNRLDSTLTNAVANGAISNLVGVWSYAFRPTRHNAKQKILFPGKTVPDRFGAPWAGRKYELVLPARTGNDGMQDGYDVVNHLSNLPFTEEFISVKLCRLLVHDEFVHGEYDYTSPSLSEEGKLVHACMLAWENSSPKGQIRDVLRVIVNSPLFRSHGGSMQKAKTPMEFCVSAIRALRADLGKGSYSASTDGWSISGRDRGGAAAPMTRMGVMRLFNRVEPDGYPESASPWISAGTLAERSRFIQSYLMSPSDPLKNDSISGGNMNLSDPTRLFKAKVANDKWNDASAVCDYFLSILLPAEGRGNLSDYRETGIRFLNLSDDGAVASPFSLLGAESAAYDTRVRALVSLYMISPRFEEQ